MAVASVFSKAHVHESSRADESDIRELHSHEKTHTTIRISSVVSCKINDSLCIVDVYIHENCRHSIVPFKSVKITVLFSMSVAVSLCVFRIEVSDVCTLEAEKQIGEVVI
jgi:hypothetical protein